MNATVIQNTIIYLISKYNKAMFFCQTYQFTEYFLGIHCASRIVWIDDHYAASARGYFTLDVR